MQIDLNVEPIRGTLAAAGDTPEEEFSGWLELASLIERARLGSESGTRAEGSAARE